MVGEAGAVLRVSDRIRAREATQPEVAQQSKTPAQIERERLMKVYGDAYDREQMAEKEAQTKRQRIAEEKRRVEAAHRLDDIRMAETRRDVAERNSRAVVDRMLHDSLRAEVMYILNKHDLFGQCGEVLAIVRDELHCEKLGAGWETACQLFKERQGKR
jgi:hypothetical protein